MLPRGLVEASADFEAAAESQWLPELNMAGTAAITKRSAMKPQP
jgi:hypothetical protein